MTARFVARFGVAALAATMAWVALWSWNGLVEQPGRFLSPALVGGLLLVAVGAVGRTLRWPWYAVLPAQLVVLVVWFNHKYAASESLSGWIPTRSSLTDVTDRIQAGATAVNTYTSPVSAEHPETYAYLLSTSLLVMVSTDLLACGLRRVPWAGLPVIVTLTVPISVLESGLSWFVFVATSLLFMMLLATEETERVLSWGRSIAGRGERIDSLDQVVNGSTVRGSALRIGVLTAAGALVLPVIVPVSDGLFNGGDGPGDGSGDSDKSVILRNPIVDLRRDLIEQEHIPLVTARTKADPSYLRLSVLDRFNGVEWLPSPRDLSESNDADGKLPDAPGLASTVTGTEDKWTLRLEDGFKSNWLPTPYPTLRIDVNQGKWRYDLRTLDVASGVDPADTAGLKYELTGFTPDLSVQRMQQAFRAPREIQEPMTSVPGNRPAVISRIAETVTQGATTDYDRMVKLQSWFRNSGGFTYSLEPGSGAGIAQLARFLTTEKVGYCEQFAAAMAVMARALDVPARVVVGFLAPEQRDDGTYRYTSDDLHAWPEMYFSGSGWVRFEPTPSARTGNPPSWTTGVTESTPSAGPSRPGPAVTQRTEAAAARSEGEASDSSSGSGTTAAAWAVAVVLVLLVLALPRLVRTRQRGRRLAGDGAADDAQALADGAWEELCATARDLGIDLPRQRSVREIAGVLRRRAQPGTDPVRVLEELTLFVERARYGRPFVVDDATRQQVVDAVRTWSDVLAASVPQRRVRIAWVFPVSALDRDTPATVTDRQVELVGAQEVR